MFFPFFIALAVASSELWRRRIGYLKQNGEDFIEDCISGLPDDILLSILSRLSFNEAVKTSILSRRWRYLYSSMPIIDFNSLTMFGRPERDHVCTRYLQKFVNGVNQFIQLYSGSKIFSFRFGFCLGREFAADTERWIRFAIRMGVEELDINFKCDRSLPFCAILQLDFSNLCEFSYQRLCEASKLRRLHLHGCIVMPNFNVKLNFLKSLQLDDVPLGGREVEDILSCCSNLEQLGIRRCILPAKLCIHGPSLHLKFLSVVGCVGLETVDLCDINITVFECFHIYLIKFSFSRIPKLERVFLHICHNDNVSYIFNELPKDFPQLKTLLVRIDAEQVRYIPTRITMFSSLRQLELIVKMSGGVDLLKIYPILLACPLLQKFCLVMIPLEHIIFRGTEEPPFCRHRHLEEVKLTGFEGHEGEINLALYFLRSAVVLKQMFISRNISLYTGVGNWDNYSFPGYDSFWKLFIRIRLQGNALSSSAEVILI